VFVTVKKSFNKDIAKISDKKLALKIEGVINSLQRANTIDLLPDIKKLKGSINAYRIKIGDYRLGFYLNENTVVLTIFAHRKDINKYFP
jgi:mRNA interferase RelE/StbE